MTTLRLRALWLQVHKWIGISLAILIIPISLSGAALVWHDALDESLNPERYAVTSSDVRLAPSAYVASARSALAPGETILGLRFPQGEGPIVATAAQPARPGAGRPVRTSLWLDPADGRVLDKAASNEGAVRVLHGLHGSLLVPGAGRQIVGWIGVAMLLSSLTGLWLWWPVTGSFRRGFRWRRQNSFNANLHHQMGFWIMLPLAMLSFTGAWISFPSFFGQFEASQPRAKGGAGLDKAAAMRARPLVSPALSPDSAVAAARPFAGNGPLSQISWPTDLSPKWKVAFQREGGPAEVEVADQGGAVTPPKPASPETTARTMRRWHDGTGMGAVWQAIIFIGGILPALLAVTGVLMWLRSRGWRSEVKRRKRRNLEPQPAE